MSKTQDVRIESLLLMSPSDMLGLARSQKEQFTKSLAEAKKLTEEGNGEQLLSDWVWDEYPMSADTYLSLFADNAEDAIFNFHNPQDKLETLGTISVPTFAVMGRKDDALVISIEDTFSRLEAALTKSPKIKTVILGDANHGYRGHENELLEAAMGWLTNINT